MSKHGRNKLFRLGFAAAVLAALGMVQAVMVDLLDKAFLIGLVHPQQRIYIDSLLPALKAGLKFMSVLGWLGSLAASSLWLLWILLKPIEQPQEVEKWRPVWWSITLVSLALVVASSILFQPWWLPMLAADVPPIFGPIGLFTFVISHWLIGSLVFTHPTAKPAVFLGSQIILR